MRGVRPRIRNLFRCRVLLSNLDHGGFHGFKNLQISGAAAEDAGKRGANLIARCMGMLVEQGFRGDENRGCAIATLSSAEIGKGVLEGMKHSFQAKAFDSQNSSGVAFDAENQAG
jgi:hypothetical protein